MKKISTAGIGDAVRRCFLSACTRIHPAAAAKLGELAQAEENENAKFALDCLVENAATAQRLGLPVCQDTGMAVVFLELGQEVCLTGGLLGDEVDRGVREAYEEGGFRMSVLDPVTRKNTFTNTPAVLHVSVVPGDRVKVSVLPKGFGSENMSRLYMLTPAQGMEAAKDAVVETVRLAGSRPCPPVLLGVGLGGTAEKCMEIAKHALLRPVGSVHPDPQIAGIEAELLRRVNALGIGAQGFGGTATCIGVHIETYPTHISSLPVAVNVQCNCVRSASETLTADSESEERS